MSNYDSELSKLVEEMNRATRSGRPAERPAERPEAPRPTASSASLDELLGLAARSNASDVLLIADSPVALRVQGSLNISSGTPLVPEDVRNLVLPLLSDRQYDELQRARTIDFR